MYRLVSFCLALSFAHGSLAMTLEQAVAMAIDNNPRIVDQYSRFQASVRDRRAAASGFLPQVTVSGGIGEENTDFRAGREIDEDLTREEFNLTVSQLLFDGWRTRGDVDRLDKEAEADRLALISEANNIALEVTSAYLKVVRDTAEVKLAEDNVEDHRETLRDIEDRLSRGYSSEADYAQIRSRLAAAINSLIASQNNLQDAQAEFFTLVGVFPENLIEPRPYTGNLPATLDDTLEVARGQHPQILSAIADMQAAQQEIRSRKGDYFPEVFLEVSANRNEDIQGIEGKEEDERIMLRFEHELYDGGRRKNRTESSSWRREQAYAIRRNTELQVIEGARLAWNARDFLTMQEEVLQENVDAARDTQTGYQEQFRIGRRSLLNVLDSKVEVFIARRNYLRAHYDRVLADYRLYNATGDLVGALSVSEPEEWQKEASR